MNQTIHIEVFTDYVCPWCYLSSANVEKLKANYPVTVSWVPFPLHPETPQEGLLLAELFKGRDMSAAQAALEARIKEVGLEYSRGDYTYNSRLAQELGMWANTQAGGDAIHSALYRAYFVDCLNLAEHSVLINVAESVGLDPEKAKEVLESRSFSNAVDEQWQRARQYQITGVPCFVSNNFMMSGAQPYEELEKFTQFMIEKNQEDNSQSTNPD